jgi:hypothetical protein
MGDVFRKFSSGRKKKPLAAFFPPVREIFFSPKGVFPQGGDIFEFFFALGEAL